MIKEEKLRLRIIQYTGKIERLRRQIDTGRYKHDILRWKNKSVWSLKEKRDLLLWVLDEPS